MSNKNNSEISIGQILKISLLIVFCLICGIEIHKNEKDIIEEVSNATEQEYEQGIVENNEEDYIHYENIKYLDRKEITNVVSRGSYIDRKNKEEIINNKDEENKESISNNILEKMENEENQKNNEYGIKNKEEIIVERKANTYTEEPPVEYKKVIEAKATAYCLCKKCCGKSETHPEYGVTASGLKIIPGTNMKVIAIDPNVIPLGTKVYVEGLNGAKDYGYAIAADTGSAINSLKVDLYMETHEKAYQWGRKSVKVYVIE